MQESPLDYLLSRRSVKLVQEPGPTEDQLSAILQSAIAAPDHGRLQPWRFSIIRGPAIEKLANLAISAIKTAGLPLTPQKEASTRLWLSKVPLLIAIACHLDHSNTKIPESERMLAVGAGVMNMLNAAHMLGYGAFWSTGLGTYLDEVSEALGYDELDYQFMGFLAIGTPIAAPPQTRREEFSRFVTEWTGI
jgi:nitroreductase